VQGAGAAPDAAQVGGGVVDTGGVTKKLVRELEACRDLPNPNDLLTRLGGILFETAVVESARRGLLGDLEAIVASGDGSTLCTGASPYGKRLCEHSQWDKCDCEKIFTDPDAQWGWDPQRRRYYFGHRFYEIATGVSGHDLPLAISMEPANGSDFTASLSTFDRLDKHLRPHGWSVGYYIADSGHDGEPNYRFLIERGATPVIRLATPAPAVHPQRPHRNPPRPQRRPEGLPLLPPGRHHQGPLAHR